MIPTCTGCGQPYEMPEETDRGAPCGFCWEILFAYCPDCRICKLRQFGSAPCLDDMPDHQECPGANHCPNGDVCIDVLKREWPLAAIALKMVGVS
jgi:hypothetical protein